MSVFRRDLLCGLTVVLLIAGLAGCSTTEDDQAQAALENPYRQTPAAPSRPLRPAGVFPLLPSNAPQMLGP